MASQEFSAWTRGSRLPQQMPPGVQKLQSVAVIRRQHIAVRQDLMHSPQVHAEIKVMQRTVSQDSVLVSLLVLDLLDFGRVSRVKGNKPIIAPNETLGLSLGLEPFVAKQQADRFPPRRTNSIEDQPRVRFKEMVVSYLLGAGRRRSQHGLEPKPVSAWTGSVLFEAKILVKDPDAIGWQPLLFESALPGRQSVIEGGPLNFAIICHRCLVIVFEPIHKQRDAPLDLRLWLITESRAGLGNVRAGQRHVAGLQWSPLDNCLFPQRVFQ